MSKSAKDGNTMVKIASFIVDKRQGFILFFIIAALFCAVSTGWVIVNNDITEYLPEKTETRVGLTLMDDEFVTFGTAKLMVDNITYSEAERLSETLTAIEGVSGVAFDDTSDHYKNASALLDITFKGETTDEISLSAMQRIRETVEPFDSYISSEVGEDKSVSIANEMNVVIVVVVVVILLVLLFTSHTYMEIPVLIITFGAAAILNMGTNYMLGEISFVSNSIAVVLQLALAIDYAIILCHRYTEERESLEPREAVIAALSKAIPEISSSCLTTISGMIAMMFMQFRLGFDLGMVLIKAILFSLLSVFTLMPGLLMMFSRLIDRTHHKSFVPDITVIGRFAVKTRFVIPPLFAVLLVFAFIFSGKCNYVYGYSTLDTYKQSESEIAAEKINDTFGTDNMIVVMVPRGDYEKEGILISALENLEITESVTGLASIEANDDYVLTDALTPRQFAEFTDLDIEVAKLLYSAYAVDDESYGQIISGLEGYAVPLLDMFDFLCEQKDEGYITLDDELSDKLDDLNSQLTDAKAQLLGENYSRILIMSSLDEEGENTFNWLDKLHEVVKKYYPNDAYIVGNSTSDYDLSSSFVDDNKLISVLSALFVIIILVFTFKSAGLPVLLMMVIQGSIWINFSEPVLTDTNIFFLSFLIVSSIQMGANIDYAIVVCTRYMDLKTVMNPKEAAVEAVNQAFPTIVTSGTILAAAGSLIGFMSSECAISSIGICLGRGTVISIVLVMLVLPQLLLLGDTIIEKTSFTIKATRLIKSYTGVTVLNGRVRGYVSGFVDAQINGVVKGDINALLNSESPKASGEGVKQRINAKLEKEGIEKTSIMEEGQDDNDEDDD